jgi:hypothetical protein
VLGLGIDRLLDAFRSLLIEIRLVHPCAQSDG